MKHFATFLLSLLILFCFENGAAQSRTKTNFGSRWEFQREENSAWEKVTIPHTARIENLVVVNQFQGVCNYRKTFRVDNAANKKTSLYFEGVMMEADVFLNGKKIANHKGGYLPFSVDISSYLKKNAANILEVKVMNVDNPEIPPGKPIKELDFNYYGGIYRNVYLISTNKLYITDPVAADKKASGGLFVNFDDVNNDKASGTIQVHFKNEWATAKKVHFKATLRNSKNQKFEFVSNEITVNANSDAEITRQIEVPDPQLWSAQKPHLYTLTVELFADNQVSDQQKIKIGIRKAELRADGFYLNGKKEFLSGTNRHQEYPYVGYAISDEAQYRDAVKIKNAGFDFVRLSHYAQAEAFLNACDELGITVMNSLAGWQFFGNAAFEANSLQNLRDMVRRDRNHPSVIFWENSLNETGMSESFMKQANVVLKEEFPYPTISSSWIDNDNYDLFIPARQHGKAPDYWTKYSKGNRKILIAEYGDWEYYAQNAGFNQKAFANLKEDERTSRQLRAFGEKRLLQQAFNFQEASNSNRKGVNTIGEANWLMFDYNRGYSPDLESSGISDIFRIPKWSYYFYQSQAAPIKNANPKITSGPMVTIANSWTPQSPLDVTVYSNCEEVALYLNNVLIAKQKPLVNESSNALQHPPFVFNLDKYGAGTLRAEGYISGKKVTENTVRSPGKAEKIELSYDLSKVALNKNKPDIVFVYAKITDKNGTLVPDATNVVSFSLIGGDAEIIGQNPVKAEAGIATILLRTKTFKKPLTILAGTNEIKFSSLKIK
jgi:beta-galactosidase